MSVTVNEVLLGLLLSVSKFTIGFLSGMVSPIFPSLVSFQNLSSKVNGTDLYAESLGNITFLSTSQPSSTDHDYLKLSLLFATKNLCQIVCGPLVGLLIDTYGALVFLLIGAIFQIFTLLVYGLADFYYLLIFGRILEGISSSAISCACIALVANKFKVPGRMGFMYGINGLSLCIGSASGAAYGGVTYQYFGRKAAFLFVILLFFVEIIFTGVVKKRNEESAMETEPETELQPASTVAVTNEDNVLQNEGNDGATVQNPLVPGEVVTTEILNGHSMDNVLLFLKDKYVLICIGTFPVVFISIPLLLSTLPLYMEVTYGASKSQQGLVWLLSLLGYGLSFIGGCIINKRWFESRRCIILVVYSWIHACGMACIGFMPTWWSIMVPLCAVAHVNLMAEIVVLPILRTIVERRHQSRFGIMSGVVVMTIAATGSLGSFLGPNLMSLIGFRWMNIIICVLNVAYSPLYLHLRRFCRGRTND